MSSSPRRSTLQRQTQETDITVHLDLDGSGDAKIKTGIAFFDHLLTAFARHGLFDLKVSAKGDLDVDYHHTVEDLGIVLGQAFNESVGDKAGIRRYGFSLLPMDEALAEAVVDLSGRAFLYYTVETAVPWVRDFNIGLLREFFQSFAQHAAVTLHLKLHYGDEPHHIAESLFKAFARALAGALEIDPRRQGQLPSTKGVL